MRSWRLIVLLLLFAAGAVALWLGSTGRADRNLTGQAAEDTQVAYDYEARDVVLRQMGPDGRLTFQIEAKEITQLPDSGRVIARQLTMYHDPPGTTVGSPNRWTLTADNGDLPAEGGVVTLSGNARARGIPVGKLTELNMTTDQLRYDTTTQQLGSDTAIQLDWGKRHMRCQNMQANIATGESALESCALDWDGMRAQCQKVQVNFRTEDEDKALKALVLCNATVDH